MERGCRETPPCNLYRKQSHHRMEKKKAKEARVSSMSNSQKITQYFHPVQAPPTVSDHMMSGERSVVLSELDTQPEKLSVEEALQKLSLLTNLSHSREKEKRLNTMTKFDFVRYLAIENYFILLKKKNGKVMASMEVAASHFRHRKSGSQARIIRFWADYFLVHQTLPVYRQGCHVKTRSLILDEDVITACRTWLRSQVSDALCVAAFANWLGSQLHLNLNHSNPVNVSVPTAVRWMHKSDGGRSVSLIRPGWFTTDVNRVVQPIKIEINGQAKQKGVMWILQERGLWNNRMKLQEGRQLLQQQPHFESQQERLGETIAAHGHRIIFYPKFHPEFNWIEMFWGSTKRFTRKHCSYRFKDLEHIIPIALKVTSLSSMRQYSRKCFRYIDIYASGVELTPKQIEHAMKKYSSHRRIPASLLASL